MIERPFPCTSEEVRAIRAHLKTQSRSFRGLRDINEHPNRWILVSDCGPDQNGYFQFADRKYIHQNVVVRCPWGVAGDRLWVQETFCPEFHGSYEPYPRGQKVRSEFPWSCAIGYRADNRIPLDDDRDGFWRPSTQMPRWASRDTLENVSVRPERLHCITRDDCLAEGIIYNPSVVVQNSRVPALYSHGTTDGFPTAKDAYHDHWDSRYGKTAPWAENKWVWRIEHRRVNER